MLLGVLFTSCLFLIGAGTALAQDVVKVSPETNEVLLENDQIRVLGVRVKPGEKVAMHLHPLNFIYSLTDGKLKFTYPAGKTEERHVKGGAAAWSEVSTHAAENVGTTEFKEVQIELKATPPKSPCVPRDKAM
jgi:quercetin dioxygenase-like cupin family protein